MIFLKDSTKSQCNSWGPLLVGQGGHCPPLILKNNFIMRLAPPKFLEKHIQLQGEPGERCPQHKSLELRE